MLKNFWIKIVSSIPICYLTLSQSDIELLSGLLYILILDTILGVWVGWKYRRLNSRKLSRTATKIGRYGIALMTAWILSVVEPTLFGWFFRYTGIFILLTEVFSNFEKLSLLGFKLPTSLLARLNKDFKEFKSSNNKEEVAEKIIESYDKVR
jgi:toxin secretion/phage lysis holin